MRSCSRICILLGLVCVGPILRADGQESLGVDGSYLGMSAESSGHGASRWAEDESTSDWLREAKEEAEEPTNPWDEPMETERHDFTQSPTVVGRGVRQFEYGFLYVLKTQGEEVENTYETPEMLFRLGLTERSEVRIRYNYAWKQNNEARDLASAEDLRLSFKYQLSEQRRWRPVSAVELRMSVPSGGPDFTVGRTKPGVDFIYGWELFERFTLTGSTGGNGNALGEVGFIDPEVNRRDNYIAWTQSLALGAKLTRRSIGYFEWFGIFTYGREQEASLSFLNCGVDYLINNNMLIDFRVGWGVNEQSEDLFAGIGGGFRF